MLCAQLLIALLIKKFVPLPYAVNLFYDSVVLRTNKANSTTICRGSNFTCYCNTVNGLGYLEWKFRSNAHSNWIPHLFDNTAEVTDPAVSLNGFIEVNLTEKYRCANANATVYMYVSIASMTRVMNETIIRCSEAIAGYMDHTVKIEGNCLSIHLL